MLSFGNSLSRFHLSLARISRIVSSFSLLMLKRKLPASSLPKLCLIVVFDFTSNKDINIKTMVQCKSTLKCWRTVENDESSPEMMK